MQDLLIIKYYPKEESTMPFNALEALVRVDNVPKKIICSIESKLEMDGFDFMDEAIGVDGLEGKFDYYGKILPDRLVSDEGE